MKTKDKPWTEEIYLKKQKQQQQKNSYQSIKGKK